MNRVCLITGTRKGIGLELATHLLAQGAVVHGFSRKEGGPDHENFHHWAVDVADEKAVTKAVRAIACEHGQIDVLINNAGIASMNAFLLTPTKTARSLFEVNTLAAFTLMREVGKVMMRQRSGRIVNLTSVAAALDLEGESAYAASKAALESLTRTAARELGAYGITVNAVGPTPVATDLIRLVPKDKIDALVERQALKRLGTTEDVLNVVDFFLRPESAFVTGQVLYLGGVRG